VCTNGLVGKHGMSNARVQFEMSAGRHAVPTARGGGEVQTVQFNGEGKSFCWVLEPDWTPHTLVLIIHEEVVNQHPRMAYCGGIFSDGEVSVKALDYIPEHPYPMYLRIGRILEDEWVFSVFGGAFSIILHQLVFWMLMMESSEVVWKKYTRSKGYFRWLRQGANRE
jgi:hypothetical protein